MVNIRMVTGIVGAIAALTVGVGEYLLHFDFLARYATHNYDFMQGISANRSTAGHFLGVVGATLYPVGCYHIYLMLRPANRIAALSAFFISSFGFIVGAVWIGSRASISALIQLPPQPEINNLIALYELRYESLLQVTRFATLVLSAVIVWLGLTGKSFYPRWITIFNPIFLIVLIFSTQTYLPSIGKHLMPIALNVAFLIFFLISICFVNGADTRKK